MADVRGQHIDDRISMADYRGPGSEILYDYPALETAGIKACLTYAAKLSKAKSVNRIIVA
jgi:uncharacterized protein (DUF433 family)